MQDCHYHYFLVERYEKSFGYIHNHFASELS